MLLNDAETNQIIRMVKRLWQVAIVFVLFIVYCLLFNPLLLLAIIAILGTLFGALSLRNRYYQMQVAVYENAAMQKIEILDSEIVRKKFTLGSEVGQLRYDQKLRLAKEALQLAQSKSQLRNWKGAYKALKEALALISDYNLGHLPPRDMPQPS